MATVVEAITAQLTIDTSQFKRGLQTADQQASKSSFGLKGLAKSAAGLLSVYAGFSMLRSIATGFLSVNRETERLMASLKTVTGSTQNATAAFSGISKFAAETPFQIDEVATAFIRLKSLGLDPSAQSLRAYGNTASAMGKNMLQMVEAVADATTGEFERLKEFGIRAKSEGDRVSFTFQDITTTVGKNAAEISNYLRSIGEVNFAGAMNEQMGTMNGIISNIQDNLSTLARIIGGPGGVNGELKNLLISFQAWTADLIRNPQIVSAWANVAIAYIKGVAETTWGLGKILKGVGDIFLDIASRNFGLIVMDFQEMTKAWEEMGQTQDAMQIAGAQYAVTMGKIKTETTTTETNVAGMASQMGQFAGMAKNSVSFMKELSKISDSMPTELDLWLESMKSAGTEARGTKGFLDMPETIDGFDAINTSMRNSDSAIGRWQERMRDIKSIQDLIQQGASDINEEYRLGNFPAQDMAKAGERLRGSQQGVTSLLSAGAAHAAQIAINLHNAANEQNKLRGFFKGLFASIVSIALGPTWGPIGAQVVNMMRHGRANIQAQSGMMIPAFPGGGGVPITAHSGESVLTRAATRQLGTENIIRLNHAPESLSISGGITVNIDARGAADARAMGQIVKQILPDALRDAYRKRRI